MLKRISCIAIFLSLLLVSTPSHADETTINGYVNLTYTNPIKLKSSGCQNVAFPYITDDSLARENTVFLIQLVHKTKKIIYGGTVWFSSLTSKGADALPAMSRIGTLQMKICRKPWSSGVGSNKINYPGVTPGSYRLYFAAGNVDPLTGGPSGSKIELIKPVSIN